MRRAALLACVALAACSSRSPAADGTSLDSQLVAQLADGGVVCLPDQPPPFVACAGLDAGAACTFPDDHQTKAGVCRATGNGRFVCAEAEDDDRVIPINAAIAACTGLDGGATCRIPVPERDLMSTSEGNHRDGGEGDGGDDDDFLDGTCASIAVDGGSVLACVPAPHDGDGHHGDDHANDGKRPPLESALAACTNFAAGAVCSFNFGDHSINGACVALPSGALACAPTCKQ